MNELMPSYNQGGNTSFSAPSSLVKDIHYKIDGENQEQGLGTGDTTLTPPADWTKLIDPSTDVMGIIASLLQKALQGGPDQLETIMNLSQAIRHYNEQPQMDGTGLNIGNYSGSRDNYGPGLSNVSSSPTMMSSEGSTSQNQLLESIASVLSQVGQKSGNQSAVNPFSSMV